MNPINSAKSYLAYRAKAKNRHGIHSPFVYELLDEVVYNDGMYYSYHIVERVRESMLRSSKMLKITDLGAGSKRSNSHVRKLSEITQNAAVPTKFGQLLFRLVNRFKPATIVELGTSLGVGTMYLAFPNQQSHVISMEGDPQVLAEAVKNFEACKLSNIETVLGNFDDTLPKVLADLESVDFAYVDGNHTEEATLNYFEQLKAKRHNDTVLVFDDIHWSPGMQRAWDAIQADPDVRVTLDLFRMGLVFFREELSKEDFVIRF